MLVGIIADLHANLEATRAVLKELDRVNPDQIICLGDITGYYANPNEVVEIIRERGIPTIMGNHDAAVCGLEEPWFFNEKAQRAIKWQVSQLHKDHREWLAKSPTEMNVNNEILAVHGAPGNRDDYILDWLDAMRHLEYLVRAKKRVCFFGHSHRATIYSERGMVPKSTENAYALSTAQNRYFLNPGSVGQPRDRDPRAAFGLYESETKVFEFCRIEYDIDTAARKVVEAGLPPELARRLTLGK